MWLEEVNKKNKFLSDLKPNALPINSYNNYIYELEEQNLIIKQNQDEQGIKIPLEELKLIYKSIELFKEKTEKEPPEYSRTMYSYLDLMEFCLKSMGIDHSSIKRNYCSSFSEGSYKTEYFFEVYVFNNHKITFTKHSRRIIGTWHFLHPESKELIF